MAAFVLSRALGLLREVLLGSTFGAGVELDAFRAASRVTETLYLLVAGGALGSAFIPTFTSYLARDERRTAWLVASAVMNLVLLITSLAAAAAFLAAPWLVGKVLAPGFDPPARALTISLLRWMLASTVVFGVSGLLMGILNANEHFASPALAPSMYNLGIIGGTVLLAPLWGIHGVAIGVVIGASLHLAVQLPALLRLDWRYTPTLGLHLGGVREVARLMGPRVLGMAITQLNFWINTNLGSRVEAEGVVAALSFGWLLMLLPQGVFAQAIATVLFPSLSAQAARGEQAAFRHTLRTAMQALFYLTFPATIGLILLRQPLVQMLFMRGAFDARAVAMVSWALAWYAVGLIAHSELEVVTRAFYALHDTATPVWVGGAAMALNAVLSVALVWTFRWIGLRYFAPAYQEWMSLGGLALANSLATTLETMTLTCLLRHRLGGLGGRQLGATGWRVIVGGMAMGSALVAFLGLPMCNPWLRGIGGIALGALVFTTVTALLRSPEARLMIETARRRWGR